MVAWVVAVQSPSERETGSAVMRFVDTTTSRRTSAVFAVVLAVLVPLSLPTQAILRLSIATLTEWVPVLWAATLAPAPALARVPVLSDLPLVPSVPLVAMVSTSEANPARMPCRPESAVALLLTRL